MFPRLDIDKPRIAIWSERRWALGRIHDAVIKQLSYKYDFDYYDWHSGKECKELWLDGRWKDYDIIFGNSAINWHMIEKGWMSYPLPQELLDKTIVILHSPVFNNPSYMERIDAPDGPIFAGITPLIVDNIKKEYGIDAELLPIGVDTDLFFPTRYISSIKKIGYVGNPDEQDPVIKQPHVFKEIIEKTKLEPVYIFGKDLNLNNKLYKDVDILLYTSSSEGVATGICEAAACGIPVISTKVGHAKYLRNIKTFTTSDEAAAIIYSFNNEKSALLSYIQKLTSEVCEEWSWDIIAHKYWEPVFVKSLKSRANFIYEASL